MIIKTFLFLTCMLSAATTFAQQNNEEVASLARTTCYGNCPYYKVKIFSDGLLIYDGKKNVEHIGIHRARVSKDTVAMILRKAEEVDYTNFNIKYPVKGIGIIDFPVCITMVRTTEGKKTIWNRNDSPQKLVEYEEFLDELLEDIDWKKI
jgi:hypothetical protein